MTVLCVDPVADRRSETVAALEDAGFDTHEAGSAADAESLLARQRVDAVVAASDLGDRTGLELIARAREHSPDAACVLFTDRPFEEIDTASLDVVVEYVDRDAPDAYDRLAGLLGFSIDTSTQAAYPLPDNETERLEAVEEYVTDLDALETAFDRLTRVARRLFDVESASVGFMDAHEERFVACRGIDLDSMPREETVCTYTILDDGVMVVPDVREDPRFEHNEALEAAGILFYAGAPLRTPAGAAVGVFCLYDDEPREFSTEDRDLLATLAAAAMDHLDLRHDLRQARRGRDE